MPSASVALPVNFIRQYSGSLDDDFMFDTIQDLEAYATGSVRSYPGQPLFLQSGSIGIPYYVNKDKTGAEKLDRTAQIWAEGTNQEVEGLGGERSSKGWNIDTQALLENFFNPSIIALSARGDLENAEFISKLRFIQERIDFFQSENTLPFTELLWFSDAPTVIREDGIQKFCRKSLDTWVKQNDLDGSETASNQPRLVGGIAPNSKPSASNQNGENRFFTHPQISFGAGDAWSITTVHNWNNGNTSDERHFGIADNAAHSFALKTNNNNFISITFGGNTFSFGVSTNELIGKTAVVHYIHEGGNVFKIYFNGVLKYDDTISVDALIAINAIFNGRDTGRMFNGRWLMQKIQSSAMSPQQVENEANYLKAQYPEIESVQIGSQEWSTRNFEAVATPEGNVISNVTLGANEEKISGGDFEGGLIGSKQDGFGSVSTWTINTDSPISGTQDAILQVTQVSTNNNRPLITFTSGRITGTWRKVKFDYKLNSGTAQLKDIHTGGGIVPLNQDLVGSGTFEYIFKANGTSNLTLYFNGTSLFDLQIDNVSEIEYGWSGLTELYNWLISPSGGNMTEYNALKEVAGWCYYNNDVNLGATYGKLYNWYAVKLLDLDMDTANYGWRIPTEAQYNDLGDPETLGGQLKMTGEDYWDAPNSGATNETGFTGLGGGLRLPNGDFTELGEETVIQTIDEYEPLLGGYIRLIKEEE